MGEKQTRSSEPAHAALSSASPLAEWTNEGLSARVARAAVRAPGSRRRGPAGGRAVFLSGVASPTRRGAGGAAPARGEVATQRRGLAPRATALSRLRLPSSHRSTSVPRPPAGGNKLITIIPAQSIFFLDVNHGGAGITGLKGVRKGAEAEWERRKED